MRIIIAITFLIISFPSVAQKVVYSKHDFVIPADLKQCVGELDKGFSKKAKAKFRQLEESQLRKVKEVYFFNEWAENDSTPFVRYFNSLRLTSEYRGDREFIVLLAFSRYLNGKPVDVSREISTIVSRNDSAKKARLKRYEYLVNSDSLNGVYIPATIEECMKELDRHTDSIQKKEIKKCRLSEVVPSYYITLGIWMRNSWNLAEGSRIGHYLRGQQIEHADGMSALLLRAYHEYLNSGTPDYSKVIKEYMPEYKKMLELLSANEKQLNTGYSHSQEYLEFLRNRKIEDFVVYKY